MATLGQGMKNFRFELQEHRVSAVKGNSRTVDPNQKGRQNATRFCNYCGTNGHTPSWCRKKIRDEELKGIESEKTAEKRARFTQAYNKKRGPDHVSEQWTRSQEFQRRNQNYTNDGIGRNSPTLIRISFQDLTSFMETTVRTMEFLVINARISHLVEMTEINLETTPSTIRTEVGETMQVFPVLHPLKRETSNKIIHIANQELINLTVLLSADLTIDLRLLLRPTNKSFL